MLQRGPGELRAGSKQLPGLAPRIQQLMQRAGAVLVPFARVDSRRTAGTYEKEECAPEQCNRSSINRSFAALALAWSLSFFFPLPG